MSSKNGIRFFKTIGFKITLWYSLSVMVILLVAGSFLYFRLKHELINEVDRALLDDSVDIMQEVSGNKHIQSDLKVAIDMKASNKKLHKISVRLLDVEENTFITSTNFFSPSSQIYEESITKAKKGGKGAFETIRIEGMEFPFRLLTKPIYHVDSLKYILQISFYLKSTYKSVENIEKNFMMLIPALIIFSIVMGWLIARKSLAPIENINETTRKITASNLSMRLSPTHAGDELDELTKTINLMLNRIEESFSRIIQFTSDVSHELRTPITSLKTGTEVILSKERTAKEYRELHENNLRELEKITKMIGDLLILLRSDSGVKNLHPKSFNLGNVLKEKQNTFRLISETKKVNLSIDGISDVQINGDEILLRRVFSNLLDNAIKYTSPGGCVNVSLEDRGDEVIVQIKDTGIGISEDHLGRIFDRFFRADPSRSRETGGTGLGLNICTNIIELHKGKIEVKSELDVGSTFKVTLPKNHTNS
jgi:two-component system, OmpR family, heavy metal sensor histidine kinase CusS